MQVTGTKYSMSWRTLKAFAEAIREARLTGAGKHRHHWETLMHSNKGGNRRWCYALDRESAGRVSMRSYSSLNLTPRVSDATAVTSQAKTEFQYVYRS